MTSIHDVNNQTNLDKFGYINIEININIENKLIFMI